MSQGLPNHRGAFVPPAGAGDNRMLDHRPVEHQAVEYHRVEADAPMALEELSALGNEGWSLIGQPVRFKGRYIHLFKRRKATGPAVERRG